MLFKKIKTNDTIAIVRALRAKKKWKSKELSIIEHNDMKSDALF